MYCNHGRNENCGCKFNIKTYGQCDVSRIKLPGNDRTALNWNEISVPEVVEVPPQKPDIEHLDQVYVDANINSVKLIETPFSYVSYDRLATPLEITTVTNLVNAAGAIALGPIITAIEAVLAVPGLPAIPQVAALEAALAALVTAGTNLTAAVAQALVLLDTGCLTAAILKTVVELIRVALAALEAALNLLLAALAALGTATAGIPIVGPLVAAAIAAAVTAINLVVTTVVDLLESILAVLILIGNTSVLVIQPNEEGTCASGRKLILEGTLDQKIVYTALVDSQSVHSVCAAVPFSAYIVPYASFIGLTYEENITVVLDPETCQTGTVNGFPYTPGTPIEVNLCEEFDVNVCVEDVFAYDIDQREIFKNITLFLWAKPAGNCA